MCSIMAVSSLNIYYDMIVKRSDVRLSYTKWPLPHGSFVCNIMWHLTVVGRGKDIRTIHHNIILLVCVLLLQLLSEWGVWCQGLADTNTVGLQGSRSCNNQDSMNGWDFLSHQCVTMWESLCNLPCWRTKTENLALMLCYGKEVKHRHLKQARHTNFLIVNVSEKCLNRSWGSMFLGCDLD